MPTARRRCRSCAGACSTRLDRLDASHGSRPLLAGARSRHLALLDGAQLVEACQPGRRHPGGGVAQFAGRLALSRPGRRPVRAVEPANVSRSVSQPGSRASARRRTGRPFIPDARPDGRRRLRGFGARPRASARVARSTAEHLERGEDADRPDSRPRRPRAARREPARSRRERPRPARVRPDRARRPARAGRRPALRSSHSTPSHSWTSRNARTSGIRQPRGSETGRHRGSSADGRARARAGFARSPRRRCRPPGARSRGAARRTSPVERAAGGPPPGRPVGVAGGEPAATARPTRAACRRWPRAGRPARAQELGPARRDLGRSSRREQRGDGLVDRAQPEVGQRLVERRDAAAAELAGQPRPRRLGGRGDLGDRSEDEALVGAELDAEAALADLADRTQRLQPGPRDRGSAASRRPAGEPERLGEGVAPRRLGAVLGLDRERRPSRGSSPRPTPYRLW